MSRSMVRFRAVRCKRCTDELYIELLICTSGKDIEKTILYHLDDRWATQLFLIEYNEARR